MNKILLQNTSTTVFTIIALAAIFLGSVTNSFAEGVEGKGCGSHKGKMFEETDTNNDGVISHEEFSAKAERRFKKIDTDGDGKITKEEVKNHHAVMKGKYMKHHGENKATY